MMADAPPLVRAVAGFALVSGVGLALDFAIFLVLVHGGVGSTAANMVSATCAVTFVYFASVKRIFSYHGRFLLPLFLAYLAYQAVAVSAASLGVGALVALTRSPVLAKLMILPFTFGANFLFMSLLTRRRRVAVEGA